MGHVNKSWFLKLTNLSQNEDSQQNLLYLSIKLGGFQNAPEHVTVFQIYIVFVHVDMS
jgi:hypothetical protein